LEPTARLFLCARCRTQVLLCSRCDRGQIYCGGDCAQQARRHAQREAAHRYQASRRGRLMHAARSRRYRARRKIVTHQGSPAAAADDLLAADSVVAAPLQPAMVGSAPRPHWHCHGCGARCAPWVRSGFLRHHRVH
jgi:hypothetical protein